MVKLFTTGLTKPLKYSCTDMKATKPDEITYSNVQSVTKKPPSHIYSNINTYNNVAPFSNLDHPDLLGKLKKSIRADKEYMHENCIHHLQMICLLLHLNQPISVSVLTLYFLHHRMISHPLRLRLVRAIQN